jgi:Mg-chelatase subunit ChlD
MTPDDIEAVTTAVIAFIDAWGLDDLGTKVGVVTFSDDAEVMVPFTADRDAIAVALDAIVPGGTTCLECALLASYNEITDNGRTDASAQVILITDGNPTTGNTDLNYLAGLASSMYNYDGTRTFAIGIPGASISFLNPIAAAGGTGSAVDVTADITLLAAPHTADLLGPDCSQ